MVKTSAAGGTVFARLSVTFIYESFPAFALTAALRTCPATL